MSFFLEKVGELAKTEIGKTMIMDRMGTDPSTLLNLSNKFVTENMELPGGEIWPMPIILQVNGRISFSAGDRIALRYNGEKIGSIDVSEVFNADMKQVLLKTYGTIDPAHPNVNQTVRQGSRIIGGNILDLKKDETARSTSPEAIILPDYG